MTANRIVPNSAGITEYRIKGMYHSPRQQERRVGVAWGSVLTKYILIGLIAASSLLSFYIFEFFGPYTTDEQAMLQKHDRKIDLLPLKNHLVTKEGSTTPIQKIAPTSFDNPSRKIVLLGPHDRYNFGDLIFTAVVRKLLISRAHFSPDDILFGGMITVNMTKYGGYNILSMKKIQTLSQQDTVQGPYDVIYLGGEAVGCNFNCAVSFLPNRMKIEARREKIHDCPYLVPKYLLLPPSKPNDDSFEINNYAVINSMGGKPCNSCKKSIETADYIAFRDKDPLFPDSAVMMKELYHDKISKTAVEVMKDLFPAGMKTRQKIIAVQHRAINNEQEQQEFALALDEVSRAGNSIIVFFVAGTAPGHDSFSCYKQISKKMKEPSIVYEVENMWKSVALISQAEAVLSTSLHVRIIAFLYMRPRLTWCGHEPKHPQFIALWDTDESPRCLKRKNETWSVLQRYYGTNPNITQAATAVAYEKTVAKYVESFDSWSRLVGWRRSTYKAAKLTRKPHT